LSDLSEAFVLNTSKTKINKKNNSGSLQWTKGVLLCRLSRVTSIQPSDHLGNLAFILGFVPYCPWDIEWSLD
jgi:hypothetical protein